MSHLPVVAVIKAKPGKESDLQEVLTGLLGPSHAEKGCVRYALHRSVEDPRTFVFIEKWESPAALQSHLGSAHVRAAFARQAELIETIQVIGLASLPGGDALKGVY